MWALGTRFRAYCSKGLQTPRSAGIDLVINSAGGDGGIMHKRQDPAHILVKSETLLETLSDRHSSRIPSLSICQSERRRFGVQAFQ